MDMLTIIIAVLVACFGYAVGFFSCALLATGFEAKGEAARHQPACAVIDALAKQVCRYRLGMVVIFVLMFFGMVMLAGAMWHD
ncbi:hypothetical protein [Methylomonas sp. ZR1]|uniref:hypothetical protein n=1 Tax=Methylomonas sp. ZR1 TaxID=1797072 RepID=UPI001491B24F|nr:hypothetical protein [Methylomonas sp. ZR1]NOV29200.1 hypothetical protein [Methylomonas sp. ZR1]